MGRSTLAPQWTAAERDLAKRIVNAVAQAGGNCVGALSVAREVYGTTNRDRLRASLPKLYHVMPLAVIMSVDMYPGKVLLVGRDHVYQITDSPRLAKLTGSDRMKKARTLAERTRAEFAVLSNQGDLASVVAANQIQLVLSALDEKVWDAIIADAANP